MILSDREIVELCRGSSPMIEPYCDTQIREANGGRRISYGVSSFGYDIRLAHEMQLAIDPSVYQGARPVIDPKSGDTAKCFRTIAHEQMYRADGGRDDYFELPPHSFALSRSVERMRIPRDVIVVCVGKSTYARCGIIVNVTPLEPGWEGYITLELSNTTPLPARVYAGEGVAQLLFFRGNSCVTSYADRAGKYQSQDATIVHAQV